MNNERVSVIMPAYNAAGFIQQAIASVGQQNYPHWELIVIDDASTDNTGELIQAWQEKDARIRYMRLDNNSGGAAVPRNKGIAEAQGRYIAFLDADDLWQPEKLEQQIHFMRLHNLAFSCSTYQVINAQQKPLRTIQPPAVLNYKHLLRNNPIGCSTVIYDAARLGHLQFAEVGHEDYDLWLRLAKNNVSMGGLEACLTVYCQRKGSLSANKFKVMGYFYHIYRHQQKFSPIKSLWLTLRYLTYSMWIKNTS